MKIAIAGKGGTGKTTISGTLARWLARADRDVVAVDADSNPNLDAILGLDRPRTDELRGLPTDLRETVEEPDGSRKTVLTRPLPDVIEQYGAVAPDGVRLLVMGRIGHAGDG